MILFRNSMPQLDLHGLDRIECGIKIKHFIDDNIFLRNEEFAIIQGIGSGILKNETWNILRKDKRIEEFCIDPFNSGCTLVRVKLN